MKKITAALLCMAMVLALAGCKGKEPNEIYDEASKKTAELTSMDADYVMDMSMTQGEETMDISMDMNMKIDGINTDSMRYLMDGTTSTMGQNIDTFMYYENGYCYMEAMGQKFKYAMDLDEMSAQITQSLGSASMDSSYLQEITAKKDGDNQILTFTADASKMDSYVQDVMGSLGNSMPGMDQMDYSIKEVSGESVVNKEGYFSSAKVKMVMEMTVEGETVSMEIAVDMVYHNPGQTVEFAAPEDLDSYEEVDPSLLGM